MFARRQLCKATFFFFSDRKITPRPKHPAATGLGILGCYCGKLILEVWRDNDLHAPLTQVRIITILGYLGANLVIPRDAP